MRQEIEKQLRRDSISLVFDVTDQLVQTEMETLAAQKMPLGKAILFGSLLGVFLVLVSFQPVLSDLSKDGNDSVPYIAAVVIFLEALISSILGVIVTRTIPSLRDVLRYSPVGVLRAIEDTLSILVLTWIHPTLYAVLARRAGWFSLQSCLGSSSRSS